jgi:predicted nucleic acid-binding protein
MKGIVVDASVVVSVFTRNDINEKILSFLSENSGKLYSHSFLNTEVANALRYFYKADHQIIKAMNLVDLLFIKVLEFDENSLGESILIALETGDTVYDASYHRLALSHDLEFVTLDKKYYDKANHLGNIRFLD